MRHGHPNLSGIYFITMTHAKTRLLQQLAVGTYLLIIAVLAVFPFSATGITSVNQITVVSFRLDHLFHVFALIPSYPLLVWVMNPQRIAGYLRLFFLALFIGFSAEFVQYFIDYRSYNLADLFANMGGVVIGGIFTLVFIFLQRRSKKNR